jgi:hypothetical protein
MKKHINYMIIVAILSFFFCIANNASAKDLLIEGIADSVVNKLDKRGRPYTRIIITEQRQIQGISYNASVPVMFFQELAKPAAEIEKGQSFRAIVQKREYQGRTSYTALALID